ncbi:MAG TPA: LptF/LptG family permease [Candidatus Hydrogenedentes bacterium]|nr:LptF/LptG family permease [Candidatus Hydrogenedentota bacterium]
MTLYDRYLTRRLVATLFKVLLSLVLLVVLIDLIVSRQSDIARYQVPLPVVLRYYITFLPTIIFEYQAAAIAILVAVLMVLGHAAQHREITALLAGGVGLRRIARAPMAVALALTLFVFAAQETFGVYAVDSHNAIKRKYFSKISGEERQGVSWTNLGNGWTCHVLKFNMRANSGQDVFMHAIREKSIEEIRVRRIYWDEGRACWLMEDGRWAVFNQERQWEATSKRITQMEAPFRESPDELFALSKSDRAKTAAQLSADIVHARRLGIPVREHVVNYHVKFAQPALCFVIIWLGVPFAVRLRRGSITLGFGISIVIAVGYLILFAVCVGLGYMGACPPLIAAWAANIVFLVLGMALFRLTPT